MNERTRRSFLTDAAMASAVLLGGCNRSPRTGGSGPGRHQRQLPPQDALVQDAFSLRKTSLFVRCSGRYQI
jgi:hypothetical protein